MLKRSRTWSFGAVVVALALSAVACGSTANTDDTSAVDTVTSEEGGELPLADSDNVGDTPEAAGACLPDEPDCEDTLVDDPEVTDLPLTPDDEPDTVTSDGPSSSGMTVDGGLRVSEAVASDSTGILAVTGHLFDDGTGLQLCEGLIGLGERYGCDGAHLGVTNLKLDEVSDSLVFHEGVSYTEAPVTLFGELVDGSLVVDNLVTG